MDLNSLRCPICDTKHKKMFLYQGYEYYRCTACLHVTTLPYPTNQVITNHYAKQFAVGNYQVAHKNLAGRTAPFQQYISLLNAWAGRFQENLKSKKILDVGCFTGELLVELEREGAITVGIELQEEASKIAQSRIRGKVLSSSVYEATLESDFDVIVLSGVIEHVTHPQRLIEKLVGLLKPGGVILIQTPNSESWLAKLFGKYWPPYQPVEHIHLFSHKSLHLLMSKNSCEEVHFENHWKRLPIEYVYKMFATFGPEFYKILSPVYRFCPKFLTKKALPFYGGEMLTLYQLRS